MACDECSKRETCDTICMDLARQLDAEGLLNINTRQEHMVYVQDLKTPAEVGNETVSEVKLVEERKILFSILWPLFNIDGRSALIIFGRLYLGLSKTEMCRIFKLSRRRLNGILRQAQETMEHIQDG